MLRRLSIGLLASVIAIAPLPTKAGNIIFQIALATNGVNELPSDGPSTKTATS